MIPLALLKLFGLGVPSWLTKPIGYLIDATVILALLGGVYFWIHHSGVKAGEAKVTAKVEKQHAKTVAEAVKDTTTAQSVATALGAQTTRTNQAATDFVQTKIEDMHHALDVPPAAGSTTLPPVDTVGVSASIDALIDRANGASEAADAEP